LVGLLEPGEDEGELPRNCKQYLELICEIVFGIDDHKNISTTIEQMGKILPNVKIDTLVLIKDDHVAITKWTMEDGSG